jgi:toxin ParE1/3/4
LTETGWRIRLGEEAERDFVRILQSTKDRFGDRQVGVYRETLLEALTALEFGPYVLGSIARDDEHPAEPANASRRTQRPS